MIEIELIVANINFTEYNNGTRHRFGSLLNNHDL